MQGSDGYTKGKPQSDRNTTAEIDVTLGGSCPPHRITQLRGRNRRLYEGPYSERRKLS